MIIDNKPTLDLLVTGMTHHVDLGGNAAVTYYGTDGDAHIRLPDGKIMHGTWQFTTTGYQVAWGDGPSNSWSFDYQAPGRICYCDASGKNHGPITSIIPGDSESLAA